MNYKNMTEEEITYQLEWSDENEFGTNYAKFLRKENKQLKEQLEYLRSNEYLNQVKWERTFNEKLVNDLKQRIDNVNKYIDDLLEKGADKTILEAIKFMLGDKENE